MPRFSHSGGTHLELGVMADSCFRPRISRMQENVSLSTGLANTPTNYYRFIINNQTNLYGGFAEQRERHLDEHLIIWFGYSGRGLGLLQSEKWGQYVYNLIDTHRRNQHRLAGCEDGAYPVPHRPDEFYSKVLLREHRQPSSVKVSSPDISNGTAQSLSFTQSSDGGGNFVQSHRATPRVLGHDHRPVVISRQSRVKLSAGRRVTPVLSRLALGALSAAASRDRR